VVARQREARLPARYPSRSGAARICLPTTSWTGFRANPSGGGYASSSRTTTAAPTAPRSALGRGEMIPTTTRNARSTRTRWTGGASPFCGSTGSGRPRVQAGEAHAGDLPGAHRGDGGQPFSPMPRAEQGYGIAAGGVIIIRAGRERMGDDPKTSVTTAGARRTIARTCSSRTADPSYRRRTRTDWTISRRRCARASTSLIK